MPINSDLDYLRQVLLVSAEERVTELVLMLAQADLPEIIHIELPHETR